MMEQLEEKYDLDKENRKILFKYLEIHYGSSKAKELMIKNSGLSLRSSTHKDNNLSKSFSISQTSPFAPLP
jgi:hypothetical protein